MHELEKGGQEFAISVRGNLEENVNRHHFVRASVEPCEKFRKAYYILYERITIEYEEQTGEPLKKYKKYEPELLETFFTNYRNDGEIFDQASKILSQLITLQSLPNANHRTAFLFIQFYLNKNGIAIHQYEEAREQYDEFYKYSKHAIERDINHQELFNEKYLDVHHSIALEQHVKEAKQLLEKIVKHQSGILEAESLQAFVTDLYHSGSFPS